MKQVIRISDRQKNIRPSNRMPNDEMVWIPGGTFMMNVDQQLGPSPVHVDGFWIDRYPVTNERFCDFVKDTGYVTVAERVADPELYPEVPPDLRHPGSLVFVRPHPSIEPLDLCDWWVYMRGAQWRHPHGPHSSLDSLNRHPVVHLTYHDAEAFARWAGKELPTEMQWEYAAAGGKESPGTIIRENRWPFRNRVSVWLDELPRGIPPRRIPWGTTSVDESRVNPYGLHDMIGNVWEWTADDYSVDTQLLIDLRGIPRDTRPSRERIPYKIIKGGMHVCGAGRVRCYCGSERLTQRIDLSACDVGFRCVLPARKGYDA